MTITTSKQLAEALPGWDEQSSRLTLPSGGIATVWRGSNKTFVVIGQREASHEDPRAAVLALADKLEAEARALRGSVK